ncbi:GTP-binding protein Era [Basidiobolus meristosporus CBS 931.73]|uniref:GTP-binding protein Era n=1 Tax=Basidiobolus meristosporus CBS 931.73 TaxID=1314790 RepID=A0A1Y1YAB6_9FUNG|nr:GTP-binding protein Era [Basidiobolus meristosporus CBS 931.73]|eukprot:ORX94902.1 GTP-binding protein Era [Basidiobolus meristosporus CBS 931.73]
MARAKHRAGISLESNLRKNMENEAELGLKKLEETRVGERISAPPTNISSIDRPARPEGIIQEALDSTEIKIPAPTKTLPVSQTKVQTTTTSKKAKNVQSKPYKPPPLVSSTGQVIITQPDMRVKLPKVYESIEQPANPRLLRVAVVGAANAGKSTIVNHLVGEEVSIVSARPQTTRERILGVLSEEDTQIVFLDTPGVIPNKNRLRLVREIVSSPWHTINEADHLLVLIDGPEAIKRFSVAETYLFERLKELSVPATLVLNKMDLVEDKDMISLLTDHYQKQYGHFLRVIYTSALYNVGVPDVKEWLMSLAKPNNWLYARDQKGDMSDLKRVEELIRAEFFSRLHSYLPYTIRQENVGWTNIPSGALRIDQNIFVDKPSQEKIIVGAQGKIIKEVTTAATARIARILRRPIHLYLRVRTKK